MADNFEFSIQLPENGFTRAQLMGMLRGLVPAGGLADGQTIVISSGKLKVGGIDAEQLVAGTIPDERFPETLPSGSGSNLKNLNADELKMGTIPGARLPATLPDADGRNLTNLNADELRMGTIPGARLPATLPDADGRNLTNLNAGELKSGTIPNARFPAELPGADGKNLTNLNADELKKGTIPNDRLDLLLQQLLQAGPGAAVPDVDVNDLPGSIDSSYNQGEVDGLRKTIVNLVSTVEMLRDRLVANGLLDAV